MKKYNDTCMSKAIEQDGEVHLSMVTQIILFALFCAIMYLIAKFLF